MLYCCLRRSCRPLWRAVTAVAATGLLAGILGSSLPAARAEQPLPLQVDRALDCAALALVSTSIADPDSPQGQLFTKRSAAARMTFSMLLGNHLRRTVTNGDVSSAVNDRALLLNTMWSHDRTEVLETHRLCTNWFAGIGQKVSALTSATPTLRPIEAFRQVVETPLEEISHQFPEESLKAADQTIALGFDNWRATGLVTSDTVRRSLDRSSVTRK